MKQTFWIYFYPHWKSMPWGTFYTDLVIHLHILQKSFYHWIFPPDLRIWASSQTCSHVWVFLQASRRQDSPSWL